MDCEYTFRYSLESSPYKTNRIVALSRFIPKTRAESDPSAPLFCCYVEKAEPPSIATRSQTKNSLGAQIAVKMALEAMIESVLEYSTASSQDVIQTALKEANQQLFEYSQKMLSLGDLRAEGFVLGYDAPTFSIGRVGGCEVFLCRAEKQIQFFDIPPSDSFIGVDNQVVVDMATVKLIPGDRIVILSQVDKEDDFLRVELELHDDVILLEDIVS